MEYKEEINKNTLFTDMPFYKWLSTFNKKDLYSREISSIYKEYLDIHNATCFEGETGALLKDCLEYFFYKNK